MEVTSDHAKTFVRTLWPNFESAVCPAKINLAEHFRDYIKKEFSVDDAIAEDAGIRLKRTVIGEVEFRCREWEVAGVPRPVCWADAGDTYITWKNERYKTLTGRERLPPGFAEIMVGWEVSHQEGFCFPA